MKAKEVSTTQPTEPRHSIGRFAKPYIRWLVVVVAIATSMWLVTYLTVGSWYQFRQRDKQRTYGVSYSFKQAREYGIDPKEGYNALIDDLGIKRVRLMSYWDDTEKVRGVYDFTDLDWQFKIAEEKGVKVTLSLGLRQPRWPECHMPSWAKTLSKETWYNDLSNQITTTVNRYKNSPALESYQLENEFFLKVFGECTDFSRDRLVNEYNLVKKLDQSKPVIISRSNNGLGIAVGKPVPDIGGMSVYRKAWDKYITRRYFTYPFPVIHYSYLSGMTKLLTGKEMMLHELQLEPWCPGRTQDCSISEQDKSMSIKQIHSNIEFARKIGMTEIDMWGGEWWYWRKTKLNDSGPWEAVRYEINR